jgi:DNA-binding transcriptional ArsR family regulator
MKRTGDRNRDLLACLGDASRFRIVRTLCEGARCVSELARDVSLSQSCTTRHLQALQRAGFVSGEREGKRVVFRMCTDDPRVSELVRWIGDDPAAGAPRRADRGGAPAGATAREPGRPTRTRGAAGGGGKASTPERVSPPGPAAEGAPSTRMPATAPRPPAGASPTRPESEDLPVAREPAPVRRPQDLEDYLL